MRGRAACRGRCRRTAACQCQFKRLMKRARDAWPVDALSATARRNEMRWTEGGKETSRAAGVFIRRPTDSLRMRQESLPRGVARSHPSWVSEGGISYSQRTACRFGVLVSADRQSRIASYRTSQPSRRRACQSGRYSGRVFEREAPRLLCRSSIIILSWSVRRVGGWRLLSNGEGFWTAGKISGRVLVVSPEMRYACTQKLPRSYMHLCKICLYHVISAPITPYPGCPHDASRRTRPTAIVTAFRSDKLANVPGNHNASPDGALPNSESHSSSRLPSFHRDGPSLCHSAMLQPSRVIAWQAPSPKHASPRHKEPPQPVTSTPNEPG